MFYWLFFVFCWLLRPGLECGARCTTTPPDDLDACRPSGSMSIRVKGPYEYGGGISGGQTKGKRIRKHLKNKRNIKTHILGEEN